MADINARNVKNQQPLDIATDEEVKRVLQEEFHDRPFRSMTLDLFNAAREGNLQLVQVLVDRGAKPDHWEYYTGTFFDGNTPLKRACYFGHFDIVKYLVLKAGAQLDFQQQDGLSVWETPLIMTCTHDADHIEIARFLLEQGANVNNGGYSVRDWCSPLHQAAFDGRLEHAKLFMSYEANLNALSNACNGDVPRKPIDLADNEEIRQAILDEPNRRIHEAPTRKRCVDQVDGIAEQNNGQRSPKGGEEGKVADEDQDSEPSDGEDD